MGINRQSEIETELQVGPTDQGMVRIYIRAGEVDLPMDFTPDEAEEIAAELKSASTIARAASGGSRRRRD